ncbi:hypothetical protein H6F86_20885 [Phormidium sp. FACHB-592]|uniref:Type II secretion system GspH family protein n=1 Tax=Stenomitos frigidus AS-A4 TaxID=2933935 RepID=A0ABV0KER3_9CYAN|nr:hypothetical protein [Phormidium sp. FACHB-592]
MIELLVAIGVLSILAALALPAYLNQIRKAQRVQALTDIEAMKPEIIGYRQKNGRFPPDVQPNVKPDEVPSFKLPPDSAWGKSIDYNSHCLSTPDGKIARVVRINSFGPDGIRQHNHDYYDIKDRNNGDDVVVTIAVVLPEESEQCPP